jgi:hypothetical protein
MNRKTIATLLGLGGWVAMGACTSSTDNRPPLAGDHPLHGDAGASSSSSGSGSGSGSGGQGDDGSTVGDAGPTEPSDAAVYDGPSTPPSDSAMVDPTCSPNQKWGTATNVTITGVQGFASQPLVTVTNDELTIAWVVDNGNGQGSVFYADRTSKSDAFGSPTQLMAMSAGGSSYFVDGSLVTDGGDGYFAFDRVTLSSDGLTLVGVAVGGLHMAEFDRSVRTASFDTTPLESSYHELAAILMAGEKLGDPVLAPNGRELVYSRYGLDPSITIQDSFLATGPVWPGGSGESTTALEGSSGKRKHPTSMTADRMSLFVWDEAGQAYGVLRDSPTSQFNYAIPFGARFSIQVNGACTRIYFVASSGSSYVLQQADAM